MANDGILYISKKNQPELSDGAIAKSVTGAWLVKQGEIDEQQKAGIKMNEGSLLVYDKGTWLAPGGKNENIAASGATVEQKKDGKTVSKWSSEETGITENGLISFSGEGKRYVYFGALPGMDVKDAERLADAYKRGDKSYYEELGKIYKKQGIEVDMEKVQKLVEEAGKAENKDEKNKKYAEAQKIIDTAVKDHYVEIVKEKLGSDAIVGQVVELIRKGDIAGALNTVKNKPVDGEAAADKIAKAMGFKSVEPAAGQRSQSASLLEGENKTLVTAWNKDGMYQRQEGTFQYLLAEGGLVSTHTMSGAQVMEGEEGKGIWTRNGNFLLLTSGTNKNYMTLTENGLLDMARVNMISYKGIGLLADMMGAYGVSLASFTLVGEGGVLK